MTDAASTRDRGAGGGRSLRANLGALAAFLAVCFAVSAIGGAVTSTTVDTWYQSLAKPSFTPPDWLFAPVWSTLYAIMAVAGWLVWRRAGFGAGPGGGRRALTAFAAQLAFNLAWSVLFFGMTWIAAALLDIALLIATLIITIIGFWRIHRLAAALLVPYLLWVGYAAALNIGIWLLNGRPWP